MREHLPKFVVVALLLIVVGVPLLLRPDRAASEPADGDRPVLVVYTPHMESIRQEFARAFNRWRAGQGRPPVDFDWRTMGGASDLRKTVLSQLTDLAREGREDAGIGADLFFGGGDYEHDKLAEGITLKRDGETVRLPATVPPDLPPGLLEEAFPAPEIGGNRLYHPDRRWIGVVLSSFGIVYNRDVLELLELPRPGTWSDLADPRYRGWIALADPGHSGSAGATYHVILRRLGWHEGWAMLRRTFANARYFTNGASKVPVDVSAGEAAAGMCIDFYGRFQAGAIGGDRVGYADPPGLTAVTADPVAILRGAPHHELASEFIAWLLSRESQTLWQLEAGSPGGPEQFELRRLPARRDLYQPGVMAERTDPEANPFATARAIPDAMPGFYGLVAPIAHAMAIDIHDDLAAAWAAIQRTDPEHPNYPKMLARFDAMPEELTIHWPDAELETEWQRAIASPDHPRHEEAARTLDTFFDQLGERLAGDAMLDRRLAWTRFFRDNYREVVRLAPSE
ncbi:MAG: extracellular solute-binding protein [Phycisphaeraceae bacterium]